MTSIPICILKIWYWILKIWTACMKMISCSDALFKDVMASFSTTPKFIYIADMTVVTVVTDVVDMTDSMTWLTSWHGICVAGVTVGRTWQRCWLDFRHIIVLPVQTWNTFLFRRSVSTLLIVWEASYNNQWIFLATWTVPDGITVNPIKYQVGNICINNKNVISVDVM